MIDLCYLSGLSMAGNGLFIMGMARNRKDLNFLGLEINGKV